MSRYIFADTETTGLTDDREIVQIAYVVKGKEDNVLMNRLYKPAIPIEFEAMEVHHITEEMVADKEPLTKSDLLMLGLEKLNNSDNYFIAHNADFDIDMLKRHDFDCQMKIIDTLRCAKHLLPDAKRHKLGVIYYQYGLYKKMPDLMKEYEMDSSRSMAHDAAFDVLMLILVTRLLTAKAGSVERLVELTQTPVTLKVFTFGKYKDKSIEKTVLSDRGYANWMLTNMKDLDEDMRHTLTTLLKRG